MNEKFKISNLGLEFVQKCSGILSNFVVENEELFNDDDDFLESTQILVHNALDIMNSNRLKHIDDASLKQVSLAFKLYYQNLDSPLLTEGFTNDFTAVTRTFE